MSDITSIRLWMTILLSFAIPRSYASDTSLPALHFGHISVENGLPTDEVRQVYQDKDGYI